MPSIDFTRAVVFAAIVWATVSAIVMWFFSSSSDGPFGFDYNHEVDFILGTITMTSSFWIAFSYRWITSGSSLPRGGIIAYTVALICFWYIWSDNIHEQLWPAFYSSLTFVMFWLFQWLDRQRT